jgi:hypothetical protein
MNKLLKTIHNATTGEVIQREFNDDEYKQYLSDREETEMLIAQAEAKTSAKTELLAKLGISAEEAKLLLS